MMVEKNLQINMLWSVEVNERETFHYIEAFILHLIMI